MIVRHGFDAECAKVLMSLDPAEDMTERCKAAEFWGLYDPEPCGAIVIEEGCIHVSSLKPCGFAVRRIVNDALKRLPFLIAPIRIDNLRAQKLALGMGFVFLMESDGWNLYRRERS